MDTNREFVSRVLGGMKVFTKDGHTSKRYVLSIGRTLAKNLMSQKLDEMTLFRENGIIRYLRCFEMEAVENIECCNIPEFRHCKSLMKSVCPLPELIFGKNGSSLIDVMSIDDGHIYDPQSARDSIIRSKRKYTMPDRRFYDIADGYLYLRDSETESVNLRLITPNLWELDEKSSCCDVTCKPYWDYEFVCPDRFVQTVADKVIAELAGVYRTAVPDANPNLDPNSKVKDAP